jgi:SAM-dependent methyltransferase
MKRFNNPLKDAGYLAYRWMKPFADPIQFVMAFPRYARFLGEWIKYKGMAGAEQTRLIDTFPCLNDRTSTSGIDEHYFFQDRWAFARILESGAPEHVDVGSRLDLIGFLTTVCKVTFVDIRPFVVPVDNLTSREGSILKMPYADASVRSLSCLHVAEHIGLGRYGDPLEPAGTAKACAELQRILAPGGHLYFSLPVGKPRICFNAHRIHAPGRILELFSELTLLELSGVTDAGAFIRNIDKDVLSRSDYACGMFHFTRNLKS